VYVHDAFIAEAGGLAMLVVTSWLMEKFESIGNVQFRFQVWRKKQTCV
jgi:hypothetical protein